MDLLVHQNEKKSKHVILDFSKYVPSGTVVAQWKWVIAQSEKQWFNTQFLLLVELPVDYKSVRNEMRTLPQCVSVFSCVLVNMTQSIKVF